MAPRRFVTTSSTRSNYCDCVSLVVLYSELHISPTLLCIFSECYQLVLPDVFDFVVYELISVS